MRIDPKKLIVFDADVIIHFGKAGRLAYLKDIFPDNKKVILDKVRKEIRSSKISDDIDQLVNFFKVLEVIPFPKDIEMIREYSLLRKDIGEGESACLAFCKFSKDVVASSNLKDISDYCKGNKVDYLTTMDFVYEAFRLKVFSHQECDEFISIVLNKGSKLPFKTFQQYLNTTY